MHSPRNTLSERVVAAIRCAAFVWVPCLALVVAVASCLSFQVPGPGDPLTESYEPIKTLKFFYKRGADPHKWGPMPNFVFGPCYAPLLAYWKASGSLGSLSPRYPYGLVRPHEQIGALIVLARLAVLALGLAATAFLARSLIRAFQAPWVTLLTVTVLTLAAPQTVLALSSTKPDGLMLALATAALAVYVRVVTEGLTLRRGVWMSVLATASLSRKELTAMLFVLPYVGLAVDGCLRYRNDSINRRAFWRNYGACIAAGVISYLVLNVAYAPAAWLERMRIVFGSLKDPSIWAPPEQTVGSYLASGLWHGFTVLGYGGTALLLASAVLTPALGKPRLAALLWLPALSHVVLVMLTAGYLADYFLLPLPVALCLPATLAGATLVGRLAARARPLLRLAAKAVVVVVVLFAAWVGWTFNRAYLASHPFTLAEHFVTSRFSPDESVYPVTLWPRHPGSTRLAYLGYTVDDRPLFDVMRAAPNDRPRWLLIDRQAALFLAQFKLKPARAAFWEEGTSFDYSAFDGPESLGYHLTETIYPETPPFCSPWLVPGLPELLERNRLLVYRNPAQS